MIILFILAPVDHNSQIPYDKCVCVPNHVELFGPWSEAHHTPLSLGFSRQDYWSSLPFPSPGNLPTPETEPVSPASPALEGGFFFFLITEPPGKPPMTNIIPIFHIGKLVDLDF